MVKWMPQRGRKKERKVFFQPGRIGRTGGNRAEEEEGGKKESS